MDNSVDKVSILEIIEHVELLIPPSTRRARVKRGTGLCTQCSRKATLGTLCEACSEKSTARAREKSGNKEWAPGSRGRPPLKQKLIPK